MVQYTVEEKIEFLKQYLHKSIDNLFETESFDSFLKDKTKEYQTMVNALKANNYNKKEYTRSQVELCNSILSNQEISNLLSLPGDKLPILKDIIHYLKL